MCSRYSLTSSPEVVRALFSHHNEAVFPPRYNIAPTQPVLIVRLDPRDRREIVLVRWGLIPSWAKDPSKVGTLLNARAETAAEKPAFRGAFRHRRCLIPADGFYEWTGPAGRKRPFLVRALQGGPFAMAGLWEHWLGGDGSELETMAILTVPANAAVSRIHDRMPAILPLEAFGAWLDVKGVQANEAAKMLMPAPEDRLELVEVSPKINNSRNEGPGVQEIVGRMLI
jgi:putative SOS response-associated peptidase YedK